MTGTDSWTVVTGLRTYSTVLAEWTPTPAGGVLVIRLWKGATGEPVKALYGVEEQTPENGQRVFLLLNATDPSVDAYETRVGRTPRCTCRAGQTHKACKHVLTLTQLIAEGKL